MACTVGYLYMPHQCVRVLVSAVHSWHALMSAHLMAPPAACKDS